MKFVRVVPAMAALALTSASLMAPAASATDNGEKPEVLREHYKATENFGKNELCRFPVAIKSDVRLKFVITNGGDDVYQTKHGWVKVTNRHSGDSIKFNVDSRAYVKVSEDGDTLKIRGYGDEVLWGTNIVVKKRHRTYTDENKGHEKNEGIYAFKDAKASLLVTGVNPKGAEEKVRVHVHHGRVLDVCKALAGHRGHHGHHGDDGHHGHHGDDGHRGH